MQTHHSLHRDRRRHQPSLLDACLCSCLRRRHHHGIRDNVHGRRVQVNRARRAVLWPPLHASGCVRDGLSRALAVTGAGGCDRLGEDFHRRGLHGRGDDFIRGVNIGAVREPGKGVLEVGGGLEEDLLEAGRDSGAGGAAAVAGVGGGQGAGVGLGDGDGFGVCEGVAVDFESGGAACRQWLQGHQPSC